MSKTGYFEANRVIFYRFFLFLGYILLFLPLYAYF